MIGQCPQKQKVERNRQVVEMRRAGATLKEIGQKFGICAETVRQIIWRWNIMERHGILPEQVMEDRKHGAE